VHPARQCSDGFYLPSMSFLWDMSASLLIRIPGLWVPQSSFHASLIHHCNCQFNIVPGS
jgi:hypothetical protein